MLDMGSLKVEPFTIHDGLAVYQLGEGPTILLFPYPHATTKRPMAAGELATQLVGLGYRVITFDPPGAYRSPRAMKGNMAEMLASAAETLAVCGVTEAVDVVGHSMGGLCALGFTLEHPEKVCSLVLVASLSGWPAALRWSIPHNWRPWRDRAWWQCMWFGFRQMLGWGNLAVHKHLDNLVAQASFVDKSHVELWRIDPDDRKRPPPPRSVWLRNVRRVDYKHRLSEVQVQTLLCAGRYDPQTPMPCSLELQAGIPNAQLLVFEHSGHAPFIEEPLHFVEVVGRHLAPPSR
jgi:proline iminopeptidase